MTKAQRFRLFQRLRDVARRQTVAQLMLVLAWAAATFGAVFGVLLIAAPDEVLRVATFTYTYAFAPPHIWGIGYAGLGLLTGLALAGPRRDFASLTLWALGLLTSVWGLFATRAVIDLDGAVTATVVYPFAAFVMIIVGIAVDLQEQTDAS